MCRVRHEFAIAWGTIACVSLAVVSSRTFGDTFPVCTEAAQKFEPAQASFARDGATFRLADGREVRLAGVIAANELDGDNEASARGLAALDSLVAGKTVVLYGTGNADRYGHRIAQVALAGGGPRWVQADLVSSGMLRVAPEASEIPCAEELLDLERKARTENKGLWSEARFSIERADDLTALNAAMGRFALVEGTIQRVGETPSRTYLDFGRRYNKDFTIVVPKSARAAFTAAGVDLSSLRGKRVRVRGVLFSSGGPAIEIKKPASLEMIAGNGT